MPMLKHASGNMTEDLDTTTSSGVVQKTADEAEKVDEFKEKMDGDQAAHRYMEKYDGYARTTSSKIFMPNGWW